MTSRWFWISLRDDRRPDCATPAARVCGRLDDWRWGWRSGGGPMEVMARSAEPGLLSEGPRWGRGTGGVVLGRCAQSVPGSVRRSPRRGVDVELPRPSEPRRRLTGFRAGCGYRFALRRLGRGGARTGTAGGRSRGGADERRRLRPRGRFWAGTTAYDETTGAGARYRLELDGRCTKVLSGLTIPTASWPELLAPPIPDRRTVSA
jgi:hypothetical protein